MANRLSVNLNVNVYLTGLTSLVLSDLSDNIIII